MTSIHMAPMPTYVPTSDAVDRHDYGVTKSRKQASTGGGRTWSAEEEHYLLQARLQKTPYKHIAAHLNKTELACRLHNHQLNNGGSTRKKRNASISSSSSYNRSPVLATMAPSPVADLGSRSASPRDRGAPGSPPRPMHLPNLLRDNQPGNHYSYEHRHHHHHSHHPHDSVSHPRLPAILPAPDTISSFPARRAGSPPRLFGTPSSEPRSTFPSLPRIQTEPTPLSRDSAARQESALAPAFTVRGASEPACPQPWPQHHQHIDMARLGGIYDAHRASFWATLAAAYGSGVDAANLEQAWKSGGCCSATSTPITPASSPGNSLYEAFPHERAQFGSSLTPPRTLPRLGPSRDKTRISAILGINASPRSTSERELVRRIEQERGF